MRPQQETTRPAWRLGSHVAIPYGQAIERTALPRPPLDTLGLIYMELAGRLDKQFEQIAALNGRAQQLLGVAAVTVGLVVTLRPPTRGSTVSLLFAVALVLFACIAGCGLRAWNLEGWRLDPEPRPLWERHRLRTKEWVQHQIILNRLDAFDANASSIDEKLYWVRWTQRLLALEVIYLVGLILVRPHLG